MDMPKCDFNKVLKQTIEITLSHGCSPVYLLHIFRTPFCRNTYRGLPLLIGTILKRQHLIHYKFHGQDCKKEQAWNTQFNNNPYKTTMRYFFGKFKLENHCVIKFQAFIHNTLQDFLRIWSHLLKNHLHFQSHYMIQT